MRDLETLLLAEGISNLTVGQLAERLSCSRRRLYEIAPTKEDIFLATAARFFQAIRDDGDREAARHASAPDKLEVYFSLRTLAAGRISEAFRRDLQGTEAGRQLYDEHLQSRVRGMAAIIEGGVKEGVFAPCNALFVAEIVFRVSRQMRDFGFQAAAGLTLPRGFKALHHLVLHGLLQEKPVTVKKAAKAAGAVKATAARRPSAPRP